jgi:hypothetical protein
MQFSRHTLANSSMHSKNVHSKYLPPALRNNRALNSSTPRHQGHSRNSILANRARKQHMWNHSMCRPRGHSRNSTRLLLNSMVIQAAEAMKNTIN